MGIYVGQTLVGDAFMVWFMPSATLYAILLILAEGLQSFCGLEQVIPRLVFAMGFALGRSR